MKAQNSVSIPVPNEETLQAINDARNGTNLHGPASMDDMFTDLFDDDE